MEKDKGVGWFGLGPNESPPRLMDLEVPLRPQPSQKGEAEGTECATDSTEECTMGDVKFQGYV